MQGAGLLREVDDESAGDDEQAAKRHGQGGRGVEEDEVGNLEDNEEGRDVKTGDAGEFYGGKVEGGAVSREQGGTQQKEADAGRQGGVMEGNTDNRVTAGFKDCRGKNEQENFHMSMVSGEGPMGKATGTGRPALLA